MASIAIETNPTKSPKRLMLRSWKIRVRTVIEAVRANRKETEYITLLTVLLKARPFPELCQVGRSKWRIGMIHKGHTFLE